ncbi:amidohydrolase family protein [Streptomyces sp. 3214.6]|uniref:amidohydrolase family protein n=1 Tax=Streptomyces sp. 3214.6 TaxID=1882757 RepID=UPI00090A5313|nr:amidohydrolase family protein [Streptomyces sp. 3214.6]SHH53929.1 Predicted metal-dependent hydrolase, TIM-barrel fold [Streptomyces sp. 3214.6]
MSEPLPLIDAHHHVWDLDRRPQPWLDEPGHEPIRRSYGVEELRRAATRPVAGRRLTRTVLVQCVASVPETEELLDLADQDPMVGAVVGWVELAAPDVGDVLDELRARPSGGYLRALRHVVQGESDAEWLQQPAVERGLRAVQDRDLGYDLLIRSHQFPQAIRLAQRFPDLPLVLDHAGKPPIGHHTISDWARKVRVLAGCPQVRCKVSGLITEADHHEWTLDDIRPVWNTLLTAFGPDRLMFGSDWPVCVLAGGWNRWAATVEELLDACSPHEKQAVLCDTATAFYRLSEK